MAGEALRFPRAVGLDERFANLLPDVLIGLGLDEFAGLAAKALEPKPEPVPVARTHPCADGQRARAGARGGRAAAGPGTLTFRKLAA